MAQGSGQDILLERLAYGATPDALWDAAKAYLTETGFDRVIYMAFNQGEAAPCIRTTMPDAFLEVYEAEGFARDDPFLTYCLLSKDSIRTRIAYVDNYTYLPERSVALIETAAEHGFNAGTSVALPGSRSAGPEGWNLDSSLTRREVEQIWRCRGPEVRLALHALSGLLSSDCAELTAREEAILGLLVAGRRTKQIAADLGIAAVTVDFHIKNARRKLGAATREAAIARYVRRS